MRKVLKNWLIYYSACVTLALVGLTPRRLTPEIGHAIGRLAHFLARRERELARTQLALALGLRESGRRVRLLTRGLFCELGQNAVELARLLWSNRRFPQIIVPEQSRRNLDEALEENMGVVFVTAHLGNWELMAVKLAELGYGISTVARESYDPRFTSLIRRSRDRFGVQAIFRGEKGAAAKMLRALRGNRVLGLLIDQDTSVPSVFVPFFGRSASTPVGAARIALRTGAPVVVGTIRRTLRGEHLVEVERVELPEDAREATAYLTNKLEERIRRHPTQWVWFHKRWKTRPER